ncbi:MAG TPA: AfsR/SARP family transcriptional regulator [Actinophytocola sp.]|jgi:DNA-binding SARP family transcriptional activator|uniref:AfsR/SARP family transcriptional regulator n=1 Tax=Actinophytocola sp. TaxID=1872138 RepID=UPI002DFA51D4|nr:AfsR/SARP family transcriptional regulator [Actinophytocola sp.]
MRIRILGPVEIQDDTRGRRLAVSGVQRPALLATLVVRAGRTVSADKLIQELWGADPPVNAANALQAHIKRLRQLICSAFGEPDRIRSRAPGYTLHLAPGETDAEEFTTRVTEARALTALTPGRAIPLLRAALALWRGPALDGCAQGDICRAEALALEENRLSALETLYDACLRANRHQEIIGELEQATTTHPLRERLHDQLMLALYRCDRQSEAIGVYDRIRRRLLTDLGAEPGPTLRATIQAILAQSPHILPEPGPRSLTDELAALQRQLNTLARRQAALVKMIGNTTPTPR